jgi:hypothetical protein
LYPNLRCHRALPVIGFKNREPEEGRCLRVGGGDGREDGGQG